MPVLWLNLLLLITGKELASIFSALPLCILSTLSIVGLAVISLTLKELLSNDIKRAKTMGIKDLNKKYNIVDMVKDDVIFCATGVTDGDLVKGIVDKGDHFLSETLVLHKSSKTNKILKNKIKKWILHQLVEKTGYLKHIMN